MDLKKLTCIDIGSLRIEGPFGYWADDLEGTESNYVHRLHGLVTTSGRFIPIHAITAWMFEDMPKSALPKNP